MKYSIFLLFIICSCKINVSINETKNESISAWNHKDFIIDNLNGISLEKWYAENKNATKNEIIVATLDTQIDLNHEDLQGQIWVNNKEIANNGIDDDNNKYIDDINGWNFIGKPNGGYYVYGNFEYIRVLRSNLNDTITNLEKNRGEIIKTTLIDYYKRGEKTTNLFNKFYDTINSTVKCFFSKEDYTYHQLDSLYNKIKTNDKSFKEKRDSNDSDIASLLFYKMKMIDFELNSISTIKNDLAEIDSILNRNLSVNFNDRKFIGDNPEKLEKGYGNAIVNSAKNLQKHNTEVSSIIAANRNNDIGAKGFHQNIKIMPLCISASGDEHDKDIAMAIYYAVDNGAKIINMSFGKEFSLKQEWVSDAFKYAEKHNVLLVHSSGNNRFNVDENSYYPSDVDYLRDKETEIVTNFINVGSISKRTDSTMVSSFSNYGKKNVDIFAPGEEIYVAKPNNEYGYDSGTSLAGPMVSGTAALIWLYYPKLTVQEVKNIILESGVTIDKKVIKPGTKDEMVPFSELCKTGKTLNTYHAMKMAEEISKRKK
jgi:subtilisin family serine protease